MRKVLSLVLLVGFDLDDANTIGALSAGRWMHQLRSHLRAVAQSAERATKHRRRRGLTLL